LQGNETLIRHGQLSGACMTRDSEIVRMAKRLMREKPDVLERLARR
jgi:hypothetical protein